MDNQEQQHSIVVRGIIKEILDEYRREVREYPVINSPHEGYALIKENLDELWDEIRCRQPTVENMQKDAKRIAVTAIRFIVDLLQIIKKED